MADLQRRLPLLLLVVVVFLFVVFLHVCLSCRPWKQRRKRRASTKRVVLQEERPMAGMKARAILPAAEGGRRPATTEPSRRYDPSMYSHLPSWETPLPPSNEEPEGEELPTFPLGSGSTQLLSQTVLVDGSASNERGEYTSLLQQGLGDDDDGGVDLRIGLSSGGAREASRTFITAAHASARGLQQPRREQMGPSTVRGGASVVGGVGSSPSPEACIGSVLAHQRCTLVNVEPNNGRATRREGRGRLQTTGGLGTSVENITRGVSNMRAHNDAGDDDGCGGDDAADGFREEVEAGDDDDDNVVRPVGKTGGRGIGRSNRGGRGRSVGRDGRGGVTDDGGKSATYWSTDEQMLLVRCKREQEMQLAGLGHNYGRMRTKEWKWVDIAKRMANGGSPKDADDCMKKSDNLFQNYKKIQRIQNASGRLDFFKLSNDERKEHNFKFRMERVLQESVIKNLKKEFEEGGLVLGVPDHAAVMTRPFIVETDAGPTALGGVLIQQDPNGEERPLRFESWTLNTSERNYSQFKRETLAVLHYLRIFRNYLFGNRFVLRVDATALAGSLKNFAPSDPTIARWLAYIWMFDFELKRIPGTKNMVDGLSRVDWDKNHQGVIEDTPPVDGFLDSEEDVRLHINSWALAVGKYVAPGRPVWLAPPGHVGRPDLVLKPYIEEDSWGMSDVGWMMELALAGKYELQEDPLTIENGALQVGKHGKMIGGVYLLANALLQEETVRNEVLDQEEEIEPGGGDNVIHERENGDFEEGEIKEAFRAEEYEGVYLKLGMLLSCEMRERDACARVLKMRPSFLVRDGHLFMRSKGRNPRRVVCGVARQIDIMVALHDEPDIPHEPHTQELREEPSVDEKELDREERAARELEIRTQLRKTNLAELHERMQQGQAPEEVEDRKGKSTCTQEEDPPLFSEVWMGFDKLMDTTGRSGGQHQEIGVKLVSTDLLNLRSEMREGFTVARTSDQKIGDRLTKVAQKAYGQRVDWEREAEGLKRELGRQGKELAAVKADMERVSTENEAVRQVNQTLNKVTDALRAYLCAQLTFFQVQKFEIREQPAEEVFKREREVEMADQQDGEEIPLIDKEMLEQPGVLVEKGAEVGEFEWRLPAGLTLGHEPAVPQKGPPVEAMRVGEVPPTIRKAIVGQQEGQESVGQTMVGTRQRVDLRDCQESTMLQKVLQICRMYWDLGPLGQGQRGVLGSWGCQQMTEQPAPLPQGSHSRRLRARSQLEQPRHLYPRWKERR
ncbi:hypothetical protein CBR_g54227 [Chara braunii]|uniref:Uncharacterized protein n=1 Tax=Chara braunii TaxID=69332 RepID=A0A388K7K8_CHABU|nr:hypothetical protein CBR_g54227 [Chara braunii]|eukprot:GBG65933.1 hypothetical protein CBR_g54227 [Chara braunii]